MDLSFKNPLNQLLIKGDKVVLTTNRDNLRSHFLPINESKDYEPAEYDFTKVLQDFVLPGGKIDLKFPTPMLFKNPKDFDVSIQRGPTRLFEDIGPKADDENILHVSKAFKRMRHFSKLKSTRKSKLKSTRKSKLKSTRKSHKKSHKKSRKKSIRKSKK